MKSCYNKGGLAKRGQGIATKGFAKGGIVSKGVEGVKKFSKGSGDPDMAGNSGNSKPFSQPVKKSVTGDQVEVRGVGAARARTATIY
jgi:hypothetical protein